MNNPRSISLGMLSLDPARISEGLSRPGIDPRTWSTLAVVTAVNVTAKGAYCSITTIAGIEETAALTASYGGAGFGFHCPVAIGDWVLVEVPEGDWNAGARIVAQVWDEGTPPPDEAVAHPDDVAIVVEPGKAIRIVVSGGGNAVIEARGSSQVRIGTEAATQSALLGEAFLSQLGTLIAAISSAVGGIPGGAAAATAITTALTTFQNAASTYKSALVKLS